MSGHRARMRAKVMEKGAETLSELELSYVLQPCARGSPRRTQLMRRTGGTFQVPYLEDPNTGVAIFESTAIVEYLKSSYAVDLTC